jgi:hypothetical protein
MKLLIDATPEQAPKGKRSIRANRWGNTNGYIAGRFWKTIGPTYAIGTDEDAARFLAGE